MKVKELIEHLKMFGEDTDVFVTTSPNDLCQPLSRKLISLIHARQDEKRGFQANKVLITAFIPWEKEHHD